jgi:hypothetical protein
MSTFTAAPRSLDAVDGPGGDPLDLIGFEALVPEIAWLSTQGVDVRSVRSADDLGLRDHHLVVYVLEQGVVPPPCGEGEDWLRGPVRRSELLARAARLLERRAGALPTPLVLDIDGLLHAGDHIEALSPQEARLLRVLLGQPGQMVSREALVHAVWPDGVPSDPRALDNRVKTLRRRLVHASIQVHTVRGRGLLLDVGGAR